MPYPFDQIFAADPDNTDLVARNVGVLIFAPGDASKTPLPLTTLAGLPLANPVPVNDKGFGSAFMADLDQVAWEGGGYTGLFASYKGMKDEAVAARQAAEGAQAAAEEAARNSSAPTMEAVASALTSEGPALDAVQTVAAQAASKKLDRTEAISSFAPVFKNGRIKVGDGALANLPDSFNAGPNATVVALGRDALGKATQVAQSIAIGSQSLANATMSRDNIGIGDSSLRNVQSLTPWYDQAKIEGTRNIAVGGNSSYFLTSGHMNVAIGRNAGQCQIGGYGSVVLGGGAVAGSAPIGFSGEIENGSPWGQDGQLSAVTVMGYAAAEKSVSPSITAMGSYALRHNKKSSSNTGLGVRALERLDIDTGPNGGILVDLGSLTGTYVHAGNTITMTIPGHTLSVGDIVRLRLLTGASQTFQNDQVHVQVASIVSPDVFTVSHPVARTTNGEAAIYWKETAASVALNEHNTAVGNSAGALQTTGGWNTFVGSLAAQNSLRSTTSTAVGYRAAVTTTGMSRATIIGANAAANASPRLINTTVLGADALQVNVDGTPYVTPHDNVTALGYDTRVTGANQVQLGNSATTTYVYGTVQNRSDARDKADVRDTQLGLGFIEKLRPVDYRWDMREDYFTEDEEGNRTPIKKDGSKKRARYHHGFIAQEVQEVLEETGLEFGGLQDHSLNGGSDVLSIGYDEVIAPLVKAVQELSARVKELERAQ